MYSATVRRLRKSGKPFALSSLALALITAITYSFHFSTDIVVLLFLLVTILHALAAGFISAAGVSLIAGACLVYFFFPPALSFRVDDPFDVLVFFVFLTAANGLTLLASKASEKLHDSQRQIALAESAVHLGLWSYDLRKKVFVASREYLELYGLSADGSPLTWQRRLGPVHPDDRERLEKVTSQSLENTHAWETEFRVVRPDGSVRWLIDNGTVLLDSSGMPVRMAGVSLDITERKQTEAVLRESEERFRNMADTAPVMIWVSGPDKLCTFFNKVWLEFTGRTMELEVGKGWAMSVHPDDLDLCVETYSNAFDARRTYQMEYRIRRADGEYRWVLVVGAPRLTSDGIFAGYIGSCTDITEVKHTLERALASQKLETVGQLASGIAHDFNNLLGGILVSAELGLAERAEGSSPEDELQRIRTAAIRGGEIVSQLMTFAGQESPAFQIVDVSLLVEEMLQLLKFSISKHAVLKTELQEGLPAVHANPAQIRQVVISLVTNASEAIAEREGVIRVTTTRVKVGLDAQVTGAANLPAADYLKLEVSDTGSGMTPEVRAKIFEPFFTTKFPGRGLGLAAVQGIVRDHGGAINVESSLGQGTRVEVLLPCTRQPARDFLNVATRVSAREVGNVTGTILVVEDEDTLRHSVSKMLGMKGFSVIEAIDGSAAVELFRANEPDIAVVLLDLSLPGMSGSEVFAELRRIRPGVKVILTSAYAKETVLKALGGQQAWDFVRKPYQLDDLANLISAACLQERG